MTSHKPIIYQLLPRLFSNTCDHCVSGGTIKQNSAGKMNHITAAVLKKLRNLGATHVWYTGVIRHATKTHYRGIPDCNPHIVKGQAGSPYAITDYYDIDPDIAINVKQRIKEFDNLVQRTHDAGLKVIIDFVPNHVARQYHSIAKPQGVADLGENDDKNVAFAPSNNFYYLPDQQFAPSINLGQGDDFYYEKPAMATGNDCFHPYPSVNDWYETVKLNYGIDHANGEKHFYPIPSTWKKMLDILLYWSARGVDGFRCDMAHMVPVEFWGWAISQVKEKYPGIIFIAELYDTAIYRDYIFNGGFDYLYDKVSLYDTLRAVTCGHASASAITHCWQEVEGIGDHMLNFLENHDEQRIASPFFAGDARRALPALVVSACFGTSPFMVYAGQEIGERGMDREGFSGEDGRTTIFDYWCVGALKKLLKGRQALTKEEKALADYYARVLQLQNECGALREGIFYDLQYANAEAHDGFRPWHHYAFLRQQGNEAVLVCANFSDEAGEVGICIPQHAFDFLKLREGRHRATDLLTGECFALELSPDSPCRLSLPAHGAVVVRL